MNNKQEIHEESACGLSIRKISARSYMSKQSSGNEQTGILYWAQCRLADWRQENQQKPGPRAYNSASICALSRRIMATEWARATGRKLPDRRALDLEREAQWLIRSKGV